MMSEKQPSQAGKQPVQLEPYEYQHMLMHAPIGIFASTPGGRFLYVNSALARMFGYDSPRHMIDVVVDIGEQLYADPGDRGEIMRLLEENEEELNYESRYVRRDGSVFWGSNSVRAVRDQQGNIVYYQGFLSDITERKRERESLLRTQFAMDRAPDSILWVDDDGGIVYANDSACTSMGYTRDELLEMQVFDIDPDFPRDNWENHKEEVRRRGAMTFESRHRTKDGRLFPVEISTNYFKFNDLYLACAFDRDITDRKKAEEALQESRRRLEDIIEFLPDATLVIDKEGRVIAWNRAIEVMTGVSKEDMLGKGDYEYALPFYGERRPILIDYALHPDREIAHQYTGVHRVGDIIYGETHAHHIPPGDVHMYATASVLQDSKGEPIAAIECIRDSTERKRMEQRLSRAEKMESLGTLAGGVAHDLNNILGVLVGYSELLAELLPEGSPTRRYADNILQSGVRGAAIIQDLLTLARRGVSVSEVVDLNGLIVDYLRTPEFEKLKYHHPRVKIMTDLAEGLLNIKGSPVHLGKTIMNLVSNAVESITDRGEVTIRTENLHLDRPIHRYDEMHEGDYVVLAVSDTGSGISPDDLGKIFEPFYTKKVMGRSGTGLGLSVVWGTVKDHNGYIDAQSEGGKGSTFTLYFPVTREEPAKAEKIASLDACKGKGESILVVDDVKEQREVVISMLERLGYRAEAVASGEEAVDYLKNKEVDLIVLDMIMDPGIDGMETYRRILEINPGQKAIIASGFSETGRVRKTQEMGAGAFIRKPYTLDRIGLVVRNELDR